MVDEASVGLPKELVKCLAGDEFVKARESMIINAAVQLMKGENKLTDLRIFRSSCDRVEIVNKLGNFPRLPSLANVDGRCPETTCRKWSVHLELS
jgi:hypothetical protein